MLDFEFILDNWLFIATGISETLGIAIFSFVLATPLAMIVARGRRSTLLPINVLSTLYVWLIDGIPLLLQILFIFLALPQLGIRLPGLFGAGVLALTVNYGSRMSKIFYERFPVPGKSQEEIWLSLISQLTNEFTSVIKDSTLISVTGFIHDVLWRATRVGRAEFKNLEAFLIAATIYLILITVISLGVKIFKSRMTAAQSGTEASA
jgi:polar amino acid transport system permease protein